MIEHDYKKDEEIINKIRSIPVLKSVGTSTLKSLLRISKIREYQPGELILKEGTFDSCIFYLFSGAVSIVKKGKELGILKIPGSIFGEMAAIDGSARSASVYAVAQTVCLLMDISYLDNLTERSQIVNWRGMAEILTVRLRETTDSLLQAREKILKLEHDLREVQLSRDPSTVEPYTE